MTPQEQRMDTLQQDLCRVIVDLLAGILGDHSFGNLVKPVLRFETLIQDGEQGMPRQTSCTPMISVCCISILINEGWSPYLSSIISQSENNRLSSNIVIIPQQSSIDRFVVNIWERIHGCMSFDSQNLLEQWQLVATAAKAGTGSSNDAFKIYFPEQLGFDKLQASSAEGTLSDIEIEGIFNR
ncbi:SET domain-containing protein, partial [Colletotrichum tamarilloi]